MLVRLKRCIKHYLILRDKMVYHALGLSMHQPLGNLLGLHNSEESWEAKQILWAYDRPTRAIEGYEDGL